MRPTTQPEIKTQTPTDGRTLAAGWMAGRCWPGLESEERLTTHQQFQEYPAAHFPPSAKVSTPTKSRAPNRSFRWLSVFVSQTTSPSCSCGRPSTWSCGEMKSISSTSTACCRIFQSLHALSVLTALPHQQASISSEMYSATSYTVVNTSDLLPAACSQELDFVPLATTYSMSCAFSVLTSSFLDQVCLFSLRCPACCSDIQDFFFKEFSAVQL